MDQSVKTTRPSFIAQFILVMSIVIAQYGIMSCLATTSKVVDCFEIINDKYTTKYWLMISHSYLIGSIILVSGNLIEVFNPKQLYTFGFAWSSIWSLLLGVFIILNYKIGIIISYSLSELGFALIFPSVISRLGDAFDYTMFKKNIISIIFIGSMGAPFTVLVRVSTKHNMFFTLSMISGLLALWNAYMVADIYGNETHNKQIFEKFKIADYYGLPGIILSGFTSFCICEVYLTAGNIWITLLIVGSGLISTFIFLRVIMESLLPHVTITWHSGSIISYISTIIITFMIISWYMSINISEDAPKSIHDTNFDDTYIRAFSLVWQILLLLIFRVNYSRVIPLATLSFIAAAIILSIIVKREQSSFHFLYNNIAFAIYLCCSKLSIELSEKLPKALTRKFGSIVALIIHLLNSSVLISVEILLESFNQADTSKMFGWSVFSGYASGLYFAYFLFIMFQGFQM
ncbi:uncharacterized protein RJT21DRAFT_118981 [Scheffersomyces amazonensis]|uniref:uncharacterized protein n=1 Tax=Scheffersomyces amazonensis TaxID=1078765 RepID=UPI00315CBE0A